MTPEQFMENFGAIAEAEGGLGTLREMVLRLAVSGGLSEPATTDDDAHQLRRVIVRRCSDLAATNGWRFKSREEGREEALCVAPRRWASIAVGNLGVALGGGTPSKQKHEYWEGEVPWVSPKDMKRDLIDDAIDHVSHDAIASSAAKLIPPPALLMVLRGMILAHSFPVAIATKPLTINQDLKAIVLGVPETAPYILLAMKAARGEILQRVERSSHGTCRLAADEVLRLGLPLPPLAEQKRIVAKVDQLMAMLDDLEQRQEKKRTVAIHVSKASLDSLVNAEDPDQLARAWDRVSENFDVVANGGATLESVRLSILGLAVRGRLRSVDQPNEAAGQLLEAVLTERQALKSAGQLVGATRPRPLEGAPPYPAPEGWFWVPLEVVCTHIVDCLHRTPTYAAQGFPAIRTNDVRPGRILIDQARRVSLREYREQTRRLVPKAGDVVYSREGSFGVAAVVPQGAEICLSQRMMQFRLATGIDPDYFCWAMNSPVMFDQASRDALGATVPHVNIRSLKRFWFPLPPTEQQTEIAAHIHQLLALCSALERTVDARRLSLHRVVDVAIRAIGLPRAGDERR